MAHQLHLEKKKYRQWVKAGLGLGYLKEGLAPFCDDVIKRQHKDILDNIKQKKSLSTATCGQCTLKTLKPDHVKAANKQCPLGQFNCNCCFTSGKVACPNNVCGAIYDHIITNHASTPPAPNWKNSQAQQWTVDPWSIGTCFINAPGYAQKSSAADIDCAGLLHVIINNKYFHNHIGCKITKTDVFTKVRQYRNEIFHSSSMELDCQKSNSYIDDMIAVLQDSKELVNRHDAQDAVKKLQKLRTEDFIITAENVEEVLGYIKEELGNIAKTTEGLATKEDCENLKVKVSALESLVSEQTEEIKRLMTNGASQKPMEQYDYEKSKSEFQKELIDLYRRSFLQVSAIPLQPERNHCNFSDVYVRPQMTCETKDVNGMPNETKIESMSDIFTKDGNSLKSIYVLGDAGSGKSSFCKRLASFWCLAHCEGQTVKDEFDGVKEMKKFEFLLYISLRRCNDIVSIQEMLEKQYKSDVLKDILKKESENVIVLLDGLDEWSPTRMGLSNQFQTEGLPERDTSKNYTIITTSRPWKMETLALTDKEIEQRLKLKEFDKSSIKKLIDQTVPILNQSFGENKSCSTCKDKLKNKAIAGLKKVPIMLLQLICLWFDDKLQISSRCAIYTSMLELCFSWNVKKKTEDIVFKKMREMSKDLQTIELPEYLVDNNLCKSYKYLIHEISRLAYVTLFRNAKEPCLTFTSCMFEELDISDEVRASCLKLGILSEDKCPSLYASTSDSSLLCFVHKSVHEYLAAVYIAILFKAHIGPPADSENVYASDICAQFIKDVFNKCVTLDEILEQENVFIMLCGLEPRIAKSISKYIYDIVTRDSRVLEYRRTIDNRFRHADLISNIQQCILNSIEEVKACQINVQAVFYLGDIVAGSKSFYDHFCTSVDKLYVSPESVRSFNISNDILTWNEHLNKALIYLPKCQHLEAVHIGIRRHGDIQIDEDAIKSICAAIEGSTSTLKALSVDFDFNHNFKPIYKTIIRRLPDMCHLVALKKENIIVTHKDLTPLCTVISSNRRLEQISVISVLCEWLWNLHKVDSSRHQQLACLHELDLSRNKQLQYLRYDDSVIVTRVNNSKLQSFICCTYNLKVFDSLNTANKLAKLELNCGNFAIRITKHPPYDTVTNKLVTLLPMLNNLRELTLSCLTLTDNILKCPSEMKKIEIIALEAVKMRLPTWQMFVDSLTLITLPVEVKAQHMKITRRGEECTYGIPQRGEKGEEEAAWQYVKDQKALFDVKLDYHDTIYFLSKK